MSRTRFLLLVLPLLAACNRGSDSYAPPLQKAGSAPSRAAILGPYVSMSDPNADAYIVDGISHAVEAGSWRWSYQRPQMRFYLKGIQKLKFSMNFAIAEVTFKETGPVTVSVLVNGQAIGKQRYTKPGTYTLELPAPADVLKADAMNTVTIEPDKVYVAKNDGAKLGLILTGAGFRD